MAAKPKPDLVALKEAEMAARDEFYRWSAANTAGKTVSELVEIDLGYSRAMRRWADAHAAYDAALQEFDR